VIINVLARHARAHLATINHGFDPPGPDDFPPAQTFLDPLNRQSQWSEALLDLFVNVVLADDAYRQRLRKHYGIVKNAIDDPAHPCHRILAAMESDEAGSASAARRTPIPPPPPRGKRKYKKRYG
jgi:hypothetical protein